MFEEMREAGFARRLVGGADFVPDHVGDDRRAMIGDHDDFKPVRQGEIGNVRPGGWRARAQAKAAPGEREQRAAGFSTTHHLRELKARPSTDPTFTR